MSIWDSIKDGAGSLFETALNEAKLFGNEYVSNIWAGDDPVKELRVNDAEAIAAIPRATDSQSAGTVSAAPSRPINWAAVGAIAGAVVAVTVVLRR